MASNLSWVAQVEHTRELPADPLVYGVITFVFLVFLIVAVLIFGKGRPHA
jgi:hypothetical protein